MKLLAALCCLAAIACGSSESESGSKPAGAAAAAAELEALATDACACPDSPCSVAINLRLNDFLRRNEAHMRAPAVVTAMGNLGSCMEAANKKIAAAAAAAPDASVPVPPPPPVVDAGPPPGPPAPPGITDEHLAALNGMMATLTKLRDEVTAGDCLLAAAAVVQYSRGFKPVKQVIREVNPKNDPAISDWLMENYFRPAFGAVGTLVNKGIEGCDQEDVWNRAVEKSDFMGTKAPR